MQNMYKTPTQPLKRIAASLMPVDEIEEWKAAALQDGFTKLWPWICYVIRAHIRRQQRRIK